MKIRRFIGKTFLKLRGWNVDAAKLPAVGILLGAPHTSNWDAIFFLASTWSEGRSARFLIKDSLGNAPILGALIRALGGIPVTRSSAEGMVTDLANKMQSSDDLILAITPKGTRSQRKYWKSGFYKIAQTAGVPVQLGFVDSSTKTVGWAEAYYLSGNIEEDMEKIRAFYATKTGIRPELASVPRLRAEDDDDARAYLSGKSDA